MGPKHGAPKRAKPEVPPVRLLTVWDVARCLGSHAEWVLKTLLGLAHDLEARRQPTRAQLARLTFSQKVDRLRWRSEEIDAWLKARRCTQDAGAAA